MSPFDSAQGRSTRARQSATDTTTPAHRAIAACRRLATYSDEPGFTTRLFLSNAARTVLDDLSGWMTRVGMAVHVDAAGNLRGLYEGTSPGTPRPINSTATESRCKSAPGVSGTSAIRGFISISKHV